LKWKQFESDKNINSNPCIQNEWNTW